MSVKSKNRLAGVNGDATHATPAEPVIQPVKLVISRPEVKVISVEIRGIAPLVIRGWDQKTMQQLRDRQEGKKLRKSREPEDPVQTMNAARYISTAGWDGMPASAFKAAMVEAVSTMDIPKTDFNMTLAKKTFFVRAEGRCKTSHRQLVRILGDKAEMYSIMQPTQNGGPYMSHRPRYENWGARLTIEYNAAKIDAQGVLNLLSAAGYFVGVGEHRPSAKESRTGEFGRWEIVPTKS